jgi:hypothetical protein
MKVLFNFVFNYGDWKLCNLRRWERQGRGARVRLDAGAGRAGAELAARRRDTRTEVPESCCAGVQVGPLVGAPSPWLRCARVWV